MEAKQIQSQHSIQLDTIQSNLNTLQAKEKQLAEVIKLGVSGEDYLG